MRATTWFSVMLPVALILPCARAWAESSSNFGSSKMSASASVDFKIVIPNVLALKVGNSLGANVLPYTFDASAPVLRGSRNGIALTSAAAGGNAQPPITLRSNMRQMTVVQETAAKTVYTVVTP